MSVKGGRWARVRPCGTEAAYRRHLRHKEVPCEACRTAANQASDGYRKTRRPGRSVLLRDRAPEPETVPMGRYPAAAGWQAAPVGPAWPRTRPVAYGEWKGTMTVNDEPASAAAHMDDRCRAAHAYLELEVADLKTQGMLYRVDDADQARERGEELDERSIIAQTVAKATRHLLGPVEPWEPGPWPPPASAWTEYRPDDPSGVRAAYEQAFNGNGAA